MRTALLATCLLGFTLVASAPAEAEAASIPIPPKGTLNVTTGTEHSCAWSVDGITVGVFSSLELKLFAGEHTLKCKRLVDGSLSTQVVTVAPNETTEVVADLPKLNGEIIGVSVGGSCTFSVNGAPKGTSSQLRLWVPPGAHTITCEDASGVARSRSVVVKSGESAMAMFKWES